jgi:uncharacterized protein (UPF0332 family)
MMENGKEVAELWQRALDSLDASDKLLSGGYADFAASRAYYAAFYAASALLLSAGKRFSRHSGVIAHIHKGYVKEGRLPVEAGKILDTLSDLRHVGDYGGPAHVDAPTAERAIASARQFVEAVRPLLPR